MIVCTVCGAAPYLHPVESRGSFRMRCDCRSLRSTEWSSPFMVELLTWFFGSPSAIERKLQLARDARDPHGEHRLTLHSAGYSKKVFPEDAPDVLAELVCEEVMWS